MYKFHPAKGGTGFAEGFSKYFLRSLCTQREIFQTAALPEYICLL